MTQDEANAYWAEREWKKWVVTLERGPRLKAEREVKFVGARTRELAIKAAKANAMRVTRPTRVHCRLATAHDLGCTPARPSPQRLAAC